MLPRILLIEENIDVGRAVIDLLTRSGSSVTHASNGVEGLELCKKQNFDLVITGSRLPVMDGNKLISELIKFRELPPILALSSKSFDTTPDPAQNPLKIKPHQRKYLLQLVSVALLTKDLTGPANVAN